MVEANGPLRLAFRAKEGRGWVVGRRQPPPSRFSSEGGGGGGLEGPRPLRLTIRAREGMVAGCKEEVSQFERARGMQVGKDTKAPFVSLETPGRGMGLVEGDIPPPSRVSSDGGGWWVGKEVTPSVTRFERGRGMG